MGESKKSKKNRTFFAFRKGSRSFVLLGLLTIFFAQSRCTTTNEKGQIQRPEGFPKIAAEQLTELGINKKPQLSADNKKLLWISSERPEHRHFQAYIMDLDSKLQKRVTFQDGEIFEVQTNSRGSLLYYSSSTDEIKEDSDYIRRALHPEKSVESTTTESPLPRTEIYRSTLDGYDVTRITDRSGFDGMISLNLVTDEMLYTAWKPTGPEIRSIDLAKNFSSKLIYKNAYAGQFAPSGESMAWLEKDPEQHRLWIQIEKNKKEVLLSSHLPIVDFSWSPDSNQIYYSKKVDQENTELFRIDLNSKCNQRITYNSGSELAPIVSSDSKWLYFESDRSNQAQIYRMDLTRLPPCASPDRKLE